eukprot:TRINITY_DN8906_c0_g1_i1.p1 TRINITY_DN8906_c0_g1~~TRINITY_DN8906_c0_g1_i1.p1  ORF type:complete len:1095 (+),score=304.88 TRINITY_DN8906_c0_g1_i1:527-3811(+)
MQQGKTQEALREYEAAVSLKRTNPYWLVDLGHLYRLHGRLREARQCFTDAAALDTSFAVAWSNLACIHKDEGNTKMAIQYYNHAISLDPGFFDAYSNLGNVYKDTGMLEEAQTMYNRALELRPNSPIVLGNLAAIYLERGELEKSLQTFERALKIHPHFPDALSNLGNALRQMCRNDEAIASYKAALKLNPNHTHALNNLANALKDEGQSLEAERLYRQALQLCPTFAGAHSNLGNLLKERHELLAALEHFQAAISINPNFEDAYSNMGNTLKELGRFDEAIHAYERAIRIRPTFADAYGNLASVFKDTCRLNEAVEYYRMALALKVQAQGANRNDIVDTDPISFCNLVHCLQTVCDWSERVPVFAKLTKIVERQLELDHLPAVQPHHALVYPIPADQQLQIAKRYALQSQRNVYSLGARPYFQDPIRKLEDINSDKENKNSDCDGSQKDTNSSNNKTNSNNPNKNDKNNNNNNGNGNNNNDNNNNNNTSSSSLPTGSTLHSILGVSVDPNLKESKNDMKNNITIPLKKPDELPLIVGVSSPHDPKVINTKGRRLRLGYLSSDFGNHPLAHLMQNVFVSHNRDSFEVFCYALSPDDGSEYRKRISSNVEHFVDIHHLNHIQACEHVVKDDIDILINLNGYTKGARNEVFALRPARVQAMFMGFPGSSGADYMQYFVSDRVCSPPELDHLYSEKLAYMPFSYFVNDHKQSFPSVLDIDYTQRDLERSSFGLPPSPTVVFCMFNQLYKIDPEIFAVWARILKRVPDSVLWLLQFPPSGEAHIRRAAEEHGLESQRLVFTSVTPKEQHVRRGYLADIFLDTPLCNAHTTGTDILWSGTPIVTVPGKTLASRVGASLVWALDCPELISHNLEEYEEIAVNLASDYEKLNAIRKKVQNNRTTTPLFDTFGWVKDWQKLLQRMVGAWQEVQMTGCEWPVIDLPSSESVAMGSEQFLDKDHLSYEFIDFGGLQAEEKLSEPVDTNNAGMGHKTPEEQLNSNPLFAAAIQPQLPINATQHDFSGPNMIHSAQAGIVNPLMATANENMLIPPQMIQQQQQQQHHHQTFGAIQFNNNSQQTNHQMHRLDISPHLEHHLQQHFMR